MDEVSNYLVLPELAGNAPPSVSALQQFILAHMELLENAWLSLYALVALLVLAKVVKEWRKQNR